MVSMRHTETRHIALLFLLLQMLASCSSEDVVPGNDLPSDWTGAVIHRTGFEAGDAVTRSSLIFGEGGLKFSWERGDKLGMFTTAACPQKTEEGTYSFDGLINPNDAGHPEWANLWHYANTEKTDDALFRTDPTKQQQTQYNCTSVRDGGLYARIDEAGTSTFDWDVEHEDLTRWTIYSPHDAAYTPFGTAPQYYNHLRFDYTGQTQTGKVNMGAYYRATTSNKYDDPTYKASEASACAHLGKKDYNISAETKFRLPTTVFYVRHIGAVARFFLLAPAKSLEIVSLRLICDSKIFYTGGYFDLTSREYKDDETKGLALVGDNGTAQMQPDETTLTNNLELKFEKVNIDYDASDKYSNYLVAYLMMYPITYKKAEHGNLFAYLTAKDSEGNELHFVTEPLADKTMKSGLYYQWTSRTNEQEGLYPIEMTATLKPWEDIVGGDMSTDLEK